jgi:N-acetyl-gamma-glutamyl-phosphate reductase
MTTRIFIDGEAGTTGLEIRQRLSGRSELFFISLREAARKELRARKDALNAAEIVILCLPDDAAKEAVALIENNATRVLDASSAHRTAPGWTYGFPEMAKTQRAAIAKSSRVSNPGCYPTGAVALIRPLVEAGLLPADWPVTINAVSGYSGGGKAMIAEFEKQDAPNYSAEPYRTYGLTLEHKHVEEMRVQGGLTHRPLFSPAVGRFYRGMLVELPLQLWALPKQPTPKKLHETLAAAYEGARFVTVASLEETGTLSGLEPEGLNNTNGLKLFVFGNEKRGQARLIALLDNLGKGASGAAVQNLNLMLGLDEAVGLV